MNREKINVGDTVMVKRVFGNVFGAKILSIKKGFLWNKYVAEWTVRDLDCGVTYKKAGILRSWNIL